ncbi:hypothetical protein LVJ83_09375 [Uruburuella testudinis]|uniref:Phage protein n=1 Tax=Uruburuella testudinis TaxID=1282863 RepID=A0ABY4DQ63_9NEIS|nr:hypothetical protein [Uruburuella testudinis]UOO81181.1 hypothetical protein LVJ83_09375 [Uruburuella testudinis]
MENQDPILAALARIEAKQDEQLENQARMDEEIKEIRKECRRTAAMYGGLGGMVVATGWEVVKAKLGLGG